MQSLEVTAEVHHKKDATHNSKALVALSEGCEPFGIQSQKFKMSQPDTTNTEHAEVAHTPRGFLSWMLLRLTVEAPKAM